MAAVESTPRATPRSPATAKSTRAISDAEVALQVQQFLDGWHYKTMNMLGKTWSAKQAVKAALEILALNGANLSESDIKSMVNLDEETLVQQIVQRLPQLLREDFDCFIDNLWLLVSATARVRRSVEDAKDAGRPQSTNADATEGERMTVEEANARIQGTIEEVDSMTIGQQILKQAVVQASREVAALHKCQETWFKSMDDRLYRLTRSAELAETAQQKLLAVETQLQKFGGEQNEKSKKALMGLAETNDKSLLSSTFGTWLGIVLAGQGERAIRRKYEQEIAFAEKALFDYKEKQLRCVKGTLMRGARDTDNGLLHFCLKTWADDIAEMKRDGMNKSKMMELEGALKKFQSSQSENTKKVMARMGADQDAALTNVAWSAWVKFCEDYRKDKEFEDKVKATEQMLQEHMKKKKESAKLVLDRMNGATDAGLKAMFIQNWYQYIVDCKWSIQQEAKIADSAARFKSMKIRQKGNAMSVQGRVNEQIKANLLFRCWSAWSLDMKVNKNEKYWTDKIKNKRQQLWSVQNLFRSAAQELEDIEKKGDSSARAPAKRDKSGRSSHAPTKEQLRDEYGHQPHSGMRKEHEHHGMKKDPTSFSLPDIHARPPMPN